MKYLITGGLGFIGSHTAEELVSQGEEVIILDNYSTGKEENISNFKDKVEVIKGDITDFKFLKKAFENVDYVIHLAALTSVIESIEKPEKYQEVNVEGTKNVLEAARINNVKKVVIASSAAIYGDTKEIPTKENTQLDPLSPYGKNKLECERLCKEYYGKHGLKTIALRYFNVYGPRQDPTSQYSGVITIFNKRIKNNQKPIIFGNGKQTRDFIFVKDVAKANILSCKTEKGFGESYNIATGKETSVNQIVKVINEITDKQINPEHQQEREGEIKRSLANVKKAKDILRFTAETNFEEGMKKTLREKSN
jgi:nucleoside-diphosphate-sugar epimerase